MGDFSSSGSTTFSFVVVYHYRDFFYRKYLAEFVSLVDRNPPLTLNPHDSSLLMYSKGFTASIPNLKPLGLTAVRNYYDR